MDVFSTLVFLRMMASSSACGELTSVRESRGASASQRRACAEMRAARVGIFNKLAIDKSAVREHQNKERVTI